MIDVHIYYSKLDDPSTFSKCPVCGKDLDLLTHAFIEEMGMPGIACWESVRDQLNEEVCEKEG